MDARALLRAKKAAAVATTSSSSLSPQTTKLKSSDSAGPSASSLGSTSVGFTSDDYATRTKSGEVKCRICNVVVKYWQPHLSSKQHKQSLSRERAAQLKTQQSLPQSSTKRPIGTAQDEAEIEDDEEANYENGQRALGDTEPGQSGGAGPSKRRKLDGEGGGGGEMGGENVADPIASVDNELDDFLASLSAIPPPKPEIAESSSAPTPTTIKQPYRLSSTQTETQTSYESAPIRLIHDSGVAASSNDSTSATSKQGNGAYVPIGGVAPAPGGGMGDDAEEEPEVKRETNAERVAREKREEREEILGRLEEEQRAQEEADQRVTSLKAKLEQIKAQRKKMAEAKKANVPS